MPPRQTLSIQTLRNRRRRAEDWIDYASWTAIATGVLGSGFILAIGLSELSFISEAVPLLASLAGQVLAGYKLRERDQWAGWGLMATYIASFAVSILVYGVWRGILFKLIIGFVYVRGWLGTLDYAELSKQIDEANSATSGDAA